MLVPGMYLADRYEILEKIGSGGMADVYKAKCHKLNRLVAIKVLKNEYSSDASFVKKFRVEAQSAAGLSHPNIVSVYDVGEENGIYYIVMELVQGITLKNYIDMKGKLEVREALNISIQIASGLSAAHQNRIIHRDVKPQNIIMSRDGKVKVTDFGIAKVADSTTNTNTAAGSVHYISPEQARGGYSDAKSDIYSLGITMYEMLTGRVPFDGENNVAVALMHIQGEMVPPRQYDPSIPRSFEKIILKCTQKKPERRYASAQELIADLRRVLSNPDGNYVVLSGAVGAETKTAVLSEREIEQMRQRGAAGQQGYVGSGQQGYDERQGYVGPGQQGYGDRQGQNSSYASGNENAQRRQEEMRRQQQAEAARRAYREDDLDDDDDEDEVNPRLEKVMIVLGVIGAIILVVAICFIVGRAVGLFGNAGTRESQMESQSGQSESESETAPVETPMVSVMNMTEDEARQKLQEAGITEEAGFIVGFEQKASEYDDDEGKVIEQNPVEGTVLRAGDRVTVYISSGKETFALSSFEGLTVEQAKNVLKANDLEFGGTQTEHSDTVADGLVIRTDPEAGTEVSAGDSIVLVLSLGKEVVMVQMPSIIGKSEADAKAAVEAAGLVFESTQDYSEDVPQGEVMSFTVDGASVSEGSEVEEGTTVMAVVSAGSQYAGQTVHEVRVMDPMLYHDNTDQPITGSLEVRLASTGEVIYSFADFNSDTYEPVERTVSGVYGSTDQIVYYLNGAEVRREDVQFDGQ